MRHLLFALFLSVALIGCSDQGSGPAKQTAEDIRVGKGVAEKECKGCHGVDGKGVAPGIPNLAGQREKLRSSYLRAQSAVAMIAVPAAVGLALVAEPAVRLLLGDKWIASAVLVRILAITYGLDMFVVAVRPLGMAMGEIAACAPPCMTLPAGVTMRGFSRRGWCSNSGSPPR